MRVWVTVMVASLLVTIAIVLLVGPDPEFDKFVAAHGPMTAEVYDLSTAGRIKETRALIVVDLPSRPLADSALYGDLIGRGWTKAWASRGPGYDCCELRPDPSCPATTVAFIEADGRSHATYTRQATFAERNRHWLKSVLGMKD
jgi:hypothetical protein